MRPEDLAASISRLSVIQETQADTSPAINILEASPASAAPDPATSPRPSNPNNLSNYFGTPQNSGSSAADSIFDQLSASPRSRATSESTAAAQSGFTDITINTPVKRAPAMASPAPAPVSPAPAPAIPASASPAPSVSAPVQSSTPVVPPSVPELTTTSTTPERQTSVKQVSKTYTQFLSP